MGPRSRSRLSLDTRLLGMGWFSLHVARRILGSAGRFLWRRQLWFRLYRNGYQGGYWRGRDFYYNRSVNQVNVTNIHNVYNNTVVNNTTVNRVSYNGGNGGINARPTAAQQAALHQRHVAPTSVQTQHEQMARTDRAQLASVNHGRPEVAATPKPAAFHGAGVVRASNAPVTNIPAVRPRQPNNNNASASRPQQQQCFAPARACNAANRQSCRSNASKQCEQRFTTRKQRSAPARTR